MATQDFAVRIHGLFVLLISLACGFSMSAQAQSEGTPIGKKATAKSLSSQAPKRPVWDKEPDSFMGFKFGHPFFAQIDECPKGGVTGSVYGGYDMDQVRKSKLRCFRRMGSSSPSYIVDTLPEIGMWTDHASIKIAADNFEGMTFDFARNDRARMLELFKARYGEPTKIEAQNVQTRGGMSLQGNVYTWSGRKVTLELSEYGSTINEAQVSVSTRAFVDYLDNRNKTNAEKFRDKL